MKEKLKDKTTAAIAQTSYFNRYILIFLKSTKVNFIEMAKTILIYKKRKLEIDFTSTTKGSITINQIKMVETNKDITDHVDNNNKNRIANMIKIHEAKWI